MNCLIGLRGALSNFYIDASIAVAALLGVSKPEEKWVDAATSDEESIVMSSRILGTELARVLKREELPVSMRDYILDSLAIVALTESVLSQAEAIGPHVKTTDAIHLASALASGYHPTIVTHDTNLTRVAKELGLATLDPLR